MHALIVEDDPGIVDLVQRGLEAEDITVVAVASVVGARNEIRTSTFDVLVLDLTLSDGSGFEVLDSLREAGSTAHVVIVSNAGCEVDRVRALEFGADDYVVKPFFVRELTARVLAVRRRRALAAHPALSFGRVEIDVASRQVTVNGGPVELAAKELDLLAFMAARPGVVFSREELLRAVWDSTPDWQQIATVTEHVRRVRSKIEIDPRDPKLIATVRGSGYRFDPPGGSAPREAVAAVQPVAPTSRSSEYVDIRRGLDHGEFDVRYQPIVELDDGVVIAVEALVRWNHPDRGLLAPDHFIADAERTGLILELGQDVLERACAEGVRWRDAGSAIDVCVNLSTKELEDPELFDRVAATLASTGLDPRRLWLEVTETALVVDVEQASAILERLVSLGIRIAIDDFGTGWASLTYLREFPVHALKIDRSFVKGIEHSVHDAAIVRSIIALARELGLLVVAEGIETCGQSDAVRALGCQIGQGFLYGRPARPEAVSGRARRAARGPDARSHLGSA